MLLIHTAIVLAQKGRIGVDHGATGVSPVLCTARISDAGHWQAGWAHGLAMAAARVPVPIVALQAVLRLLAYRFPDSPLSSARRQRWHDALRVALRLNSRSDVEAVFAACSEPLAKKQLGYLLAR